MGSGIAVIFDLDGVLVDTVASLYGIYMDNLAGFGVAGSREEFDRLNGCNLDEIVSFLVQRHGLSGREHEIRKSFESGFSRLYTQVDLMAGVLPVLETLRKHAVTIGLASASARRNIDTVLRRFHLGPYFDAVVSGDDVTRAKPHPDIYRLARERCQGGEHFVVEDSPYGVLAALRAGLVAVCFHPGGKPDRQTASYDISDLSELPRIVLEDRAVIVAKAGRMEIKPDASPPPISKEEERRADDLWNAALREKPSMFDGEVACYRSHEMQPDGTLTVTCFPSRYKYVVAGLRDRRLNLAAPIGVSAVVVDQAGKVLVGKRNGQVSEYAGCFELVPSGGIPVENMTGERYLDQVKTELLEETGIDPANVQTMAPLALIYDRVDRVFDLCVKLVLDCVIDPAALTSDEYASFRVLDVDSLDDFIRREPFVPTSEALARVMKNPRD